MREAAADLKSRRDVEKQVAIRPEQTEAAMRELKRRVAERMGADDIDLDQPVTKGMTPFQLVRLQGFCRRSHPACLDDAARD